MAKNITINKVNYEDVGYVNIPLTGENGDAKFIDTDGATAAAADIRKGKTAYIQGEEVTGAAESRAADAVTATGKTVSIPAGIYDADIETSVADGAATPAADVTGAVLGDTESAYPVTITPRATIKAGWIDAIADGEVVTKYVQTEEKTVAPATEAVTVSPAAGKLLAKVSVDAVILTGDAQPGDVMAGKTFYNTALEKRTGTATVPACSQDPVTKALRIV
ncbi:MAG: hypothetical protein Q4C56_04170 [Peptococcaceae bacterium]|nr:hypothetical protein [Peptococcaceae bacterium]